MADPLFKLRVPASGPVVRGTPGYVLTFGADGESVSGQPGGSIILPIPVEDIDATGVPNGYVVQALDGVASWGAVPTAFAISTFAHSPTLVQVGASVVNPLFSASYNQPAQAASLTDSEGHTDILGLPALSFVSPHTFTKNVFGQSVAFTLHASSPLGAAVAGASIVWGENVYWGADVDPGVYDEAFIESLGSASLRLSAAGSYGFNAGVADSSFFCALTALGLTTARFFVGGFAFDCSRVATAVPVQNANGITQGFDVFRSTNVGLGDYSLVVV